MKCFRPYGTRKEAYFFQSACVILRDEIEWVETVESGGNVLVGTDKEEILKVTLDNFSSFTYHEIFLETVKQRRKL